MLYLISEKGQRTIKIGFTKHPAQRINSYLTHSTVTQFVDWKNGGKIDEKKWHEKLSVYGFQKTDEERVLSEWFNLPADFNKRELLKDGFTYLEKYLNKKDEEFRKMVSEL